MVSSFMGILPSLLARTGIRWRTWSMAALMEARDLGRPVLVFAYEPTDHWAARWIRDLAADPELPQAINELFLPVAANVPEHPALAGRLQQTAALTADASGWPMMAVLTDGGKPFGATSWRPIRDRGPDQGLARQLIEVAEAWYQRREECLADADQVERTVARLLDPPEGRRLSRELTLDGAEATAMALADPLQGGFGPPPRRMEPALWGFLVERCARADAPLALQQQIERTLAALCAGAAHDHLGGGFFRGCTDAQWRVPFFDKRLKDQALLVPVLLDAAQVFDRPVFRDAALRALGWCLGELTRADGLVAHGTCADGPLPDGSWAEGARYRWRLDEVASVIGADAAGLVAKRFGLTADGNLAETDDNVFALGEPLPADESRKLPACIARLAVARGERLAPPLVDSAFSGEQGMLLFALHHLDEPLDAVAQAAHRLAHALAARQAQGPFPARWDHAGHAYHAASAGDLAWLARGFLAHGATTGEAHWTERALALLCHAMDACDDHGRVLLDGDPGVEPPVPGDADGPGDLAPAAVLGLAALEAFAATGDATWKELAERIVHAHRDRLRRAPLACAGILHVFHRLG